MLWQNEPLWLPKGSVRALVMIVMITGCFYFTVDAGVGDIELIHKWYELTGLVVGYYIGVRSQGTGNR